MPNVMSARPAGGSAVLDEGHSEGVQENLGRDRARSPRVPRKISLLKELAPECAWGLGCKSLITLGAVRGIYPEKCVFLLNR
jgi:hypothetical protein